ncbi:GNAT family N-acetyltransferase [bacterium]|nr:GNAT family N-acetyltransferase [bacterium]
MTATSTTSIEITNAHTTSRLNVRRAKDQDAARWDNFASSHSQGTPYHRWAWKQAMEDAYGVTTHYFLAETSDGSVVGILPAARVPHPLGRGKLCSLPYCDLGETLANDTQIQQRLFDALRGENKGAHEVRGSAKRKDTFSNAGESELQLGQKVRLLLDLPESSAELLAGFKSKHRSQINKAVKNGLTGSVGNSPERVAQFYEVFSRNMRDLGSPTHSLRWFNAISECYGDDCLIGLVSLDDKVIGGGIVLISGGRAAIPWASTLRDYNRLAPNMLLYWSLLEAVTDKGCESFDFGRSSFGEGTYRFKTQWGALPVPLEWLTYNDAAVISNNITPPTTATTANGNRVRAMVEAAWRHLPLPLTIAAGSRLRPYVSL